MSTTYILDTTVLIDHAKGRADGVDVLAQLFSETGTLYTCDIVTSESLSGGTAEERRLVGRLLDALEYIAIDPEGARWSGERRRQQREAGRRAPLGDSLITAAAWRMGATVVTRNPGDFEPFGVAIRSYGPRPQASAGTKRGSTP